MTDTRKRFDEYAEKFEYNTSKDESGEYVDMETFDAWERFYADELAKEQ